MRFRSPQNIVDEIRYVKDTFNTRSFYFEDDTFGLNKNIALDICDLIIEKKLNILWTCQQRANLVSDELIKKMKAAGCEQVFYGVESGYEEALLKMKKGITIEQVINAKKVLEENRMMFGTFFMIGFPWETRKEIDKTVTFMKELNPYAAYVNVATPYPGTELYETCKSEGIIPQSMDWNTVFEQNPDICLTKHIPKQEFLPIAKRTQRLFDNYNKKKRRLLLLSDPLGLLKRVIKAKYYHPGDLWRLIRRFMIE